jgi:hypothetical protein
VEGAFQQQQAKHFSSLMNDRSIVIPLPPEASTTFFQPAVISGAGSSGIVTNIFMNQPPNRLSTGHAYRT